MKTFSCLQLWKRPANYGGATWYDYFGTVGQNRDSGTLERSNFRSFLAGLKVKAAELGDAEVPNPDFGAVADRDGYGPHGELVSDETIRAFTVVRASHWAVGWVEWIAVHKDAHPALLEWCDGVLAALQDYPCVNDSDLSELENEEYGQNWEQSGARELRRVLAKEFDLCDAAADAIDEADVDTLRTWFESVIASGDYHYECWPRFELAARYANRDDCAKLLRAIRADRRVAA